MVDAVDKAMRIHLAHFTDGQYLEVLHRTEAEVSLFFTDKPELMACKFDLKYDVLCSPSRSEEPTPCIIKGEALLPVEPGLPVVTLDIHTSQLDDGPVVSCDLLKRQFADLAEQRVRMPAQPLGNDT